MKKTLQILAVLFSVFTIYSLQGIPSALGLNLINQSELNLQNTSTDSITIRLSSPSPIPDWAKAKKTPIKLTVLAGDYKLKGGTTLMTGSDIYVNEDWLTFPNGLVINIEGGEITLKGKKYNDGSKLMVDDTGALIERK